MKILPCLMSLFALLAATAAYGADTVAPQLTSLDTAPDPVNVSVAAQSVTLTLAITDNESGLNYANLYVYNQAGRYINSGSIGAAQRISGTELDGIYAVNMTVPRYSAPGTWRVDVYLSDVAGNMRNYGGGFGGLPFPAPADATFTVVNTGQIDSAEPVITASTVTPTTVDTGMVARTVTVDFTCTDDLAGLNYGWVYVWRPDGVFRDDLLGFFSGGNPRTGNKMAGTYQVSIPLARNSPQGLWRMEIYTTDEAGNYHFTPIGGFTVTNTSEPIGNLASALDAAQLTWASSIPGWSYQYAATSHDGVDAAASDPLGDGEEATLETTVTGPGVLSFQWRVDSETAADVLSVEVTGTAIHQEISGNTAWAPVSLTIPAGSHTITWKYAKNAAVAVGADRGWIDEVRFVAAADSELPVLQALRITPNPVNVGGSPQVVTFALEITDDFNGFSDGYVNLYTPSGTWHDSVQISQSDRVSGNSRSGTYEVTFEMPQGSDYGEWRVGVDLIEAITNSSRYYSDSDEPFAELGEGLFTVWDGVSTDNQAPLIEEFIIDPIEVDVSIADATVAVTVRITDAQEGFRDGSIDVYTPDGDWTGSVYFNDSVRTSGDSFDGTYEVTVPVPQFGLPGTWRLQCSVSDVASNRRDYPFGSPFPFGGDGSFAVVNVGDVDLLAPVVTAIRISPGLIDTRSADATIRVTLSISDDLAGVRDAQLFFYNPLDQFVGSLSATLDASNRLSGDALGATHQVDFTIPQGSAMGTWTVRTYLRDAVGRTNFYGLTGPAYPEPGDGEFTVWDGVSADEEAPRIDELTIAPASVEISGAAATVTVTARITDAQAGFTEGNFDVVSPAGDWTGSTYFTDGHRISGNEFDGVYQIELPVPRYGPPGTWRVSCFLVDGASNGRAYPYGGAFPAAAHETFTVVNTGPADLLAPVVTAIDITPGVVNTSAAPATISVTVAISDDLSGIRDAQLHFFNPIDNPVGDLLKVLDDSNRISGDAVSGTYQVSVIVPQGAAVGTWTIRVLLRDRVGRVHYYGFDGAAYPEAGDGKFNVGAAPLSTFKAFAATHHLTGDGALPSADPDQDGRNNVIELIQGTNPAHADPVARWYSLSLDQSNLHFDFTIDPAFTVTGNGDHLELRDGGGGAPFRITGQTRPGLDATWTNVLPTLVAGHTWRISLSLAADRGFARLVLEDP